MKQREYFYVSNGSAKDFNEVFLVHELLSVKSIVELINLHYNSNFALEELSFGNCGHKLNRRFFCPWLRLESDSYRQVLFRTVQLGSAILGYISEQAYQDLVKRGGLEVKSPDAEEVFISEILRLAKENSLHLTLDLAKDSKGKFVSKDTRLLKAAHSIGNLEAFFKVLKEEQACT